MCPWTLRMINDFSFVCLTRIGYPPPPPPVSWWDHIFQQYLSWLDAHPPVKKTTVSISSITVLNHYFTRISVFYQPLLSEFYFEYTNPEQI